MTLKQRLIECLPEKLEDIHSGTLSANDEIIAKARGYNLAMEDTETIYIDKMLAVLEEEIETLADTPLPFSADPQNPMKHCYQNEGYRKACQDLLNLIKNK